MKLQKINKVNLLYLQMRGLTEVECMSIIAAVLHTQDWLKSQGEDSFGAYEFKREFGTIAYNTLMEE